MLPAVSARAGTISFDDLLARPRAAATVKIPYGAQPDQFGELWLPKGKGKHAVVVMLHGGCWQASLPGAELMAGLADDLRRGGIAVWNLEYRRLGTDGGGYPGTYLDVAAGLDALRGLAPKYALDLSRTAILGHSAGGHLAFWAAAHRRLDAGSALYRRHPLSLRYAVSLAGINDLSAYRDAGPACGGSATIDAMRGPLAGQGNAMGATTSPADMLPLGVPQLIVSGAEDPIVPPHFGREYAAKAQAAGDKVTYLEIGGAGHFELIDPESAAWKQVKTELLKRLR